jgi:hypothetical protein
MMKDNKRNSRDDKSKTGGRRAAGADKPKSTYGSRAEKEMLISTRKTIKNHEKRATIRTSNPKHQKMATQSHIHLDHQLVKISNPEHQETATQNHIHPDHHLIGISNPEHQEMAIQNHIHPDHHRIEISNPEHQGMEIRSHMRQDLPIEMKSQEQIEARKVALNLGRKRKVATLDIKKLTKREVREKTRQTINVAI